jgi:hypothetical protein
MGQALAQCGPCPKRVSRKASGARPCQGAWYAMRVACRALSNPLVVVVDEAHVALASQRSAVHVRGHLRAKEHRGSRCFVRPHTRLHGCNMRSHAPQKIEARRLERARLAAERAPLGTAQRGRRGATHPDGRLQPLHDLRDDRGNADTHVSPYGYSGVPAAFKDAAAGSGCIAELRTPNPSACTSRSPLCTCGTGLCRQHARIAAPPHAGSVGSHAGE